MRLTLHGLTIRTPRTIEAADSRAAMTALVAAIVLPPGEIPWSGVLAVEGLETGDERIFALEALTWADLPLPLTDNHDCDDLVGRIDTITRSGSTIQATGVFDDSPLGREAARQVAAGLRRGLSVDVDDVTGQIVLQGPIGEDVPAGEEEVVPLGGNLMRITAARIRGAALCTIAAFVEAQLTLSVQPLDVPDLTEMLDPLAASADTPVDTGAGCSCGGTCDTCTPPLVAAAAPTAPPAAWFEDPQLDGPTKVTITDDGRVFGHLGQNGVCHRGFADRCILLPRGCTYAHFLTGAVRTAEGSTVPVGQLTLGCGHPDETLAARPLDYRQARAHYDGGPGAVQWADVNVGEDEHGVWVAGALRPGLTDEQIREARAQALSGDWRKIGGRLELVAAVSVPVPGYPILGLAASALERIRPRAIVDTDGDVLSLVAAGIVWPDPPPEPWRAAMDAVAADVADLRAAVEVLLADASVDSLLASIAMLRESQVAPIP